VEDGDSDEGPVVEMTESFMTGEGILWRDTCMLEGAKSLGVG
jgi:hypothetical protein